jgi:acetoin:2,6-dichlorophenolindophenol oxidoreductase subunit beta
MRRLKFYEAINEAIIQCMQADPSIFLAGIGIKDPDGFWGTTEEANERFPDRVYDIPNCENAFAGIVIGAAAMGKRPLVSHPRNDFMFLATDMLINLAAKWKYMYQNGTSVPVVTRASVGRGFGQGATHSQSTHALFGHFPGLYVATPCFPSDIKGLLTSALTGDVPVIIIENRAVYNLEDEVPEESYTIPFGKGRILREGTDVTIVGASLMAYEATRAATILSEQHGISAEVIDPRSIRPLDEEIILKSIAKTRHLVVADTSHATYGFAAEVAAVAAEKGFADLRAPVRRVTLPDSPAPVTKSLEDVFHPTPRSIAQACIDVLRADVQVTTHARDVQEAFAGPY